MLKEPWVITLNKNEVAITFQSELTSSFTVLKSIISRKITCLE